MMKRSRPISALLCPLSFVSSLALPGLAAANEVNELVSQGKFCSATAQAAFRRLR